MITMRQLEALRAVIENQTVTEAANFMCLSQPAISKLISNLEYETKLTLFQRNRRRLEPTPEAMILYEQSISIFEGMNEITRLSLDLRNLTGGHLTIFSLPALGKSVLPIMLSKFLLNHDQARIGLHVHSSRTVIQAVISRRANMGLSMLRIDHPGVDCRSLLQVDA
ncbi:MAG: LysR family transcriptional regulator, partial [Amylibacter sp.]